MATSPTLVQNLIREKKIPVAVTLFLLLVPVTFVLLRAGSIPQEELLLYPSPPSLSDPQPPSWTRRERGAGLRIEWRLWNEGGAAAAVDGIPCLDNLKAIKELKSRRHMEHRERHFPEPAPRCFTPSSLRLPDPIPGPRAGTW